MVKPCFPRGGDGHPQENWIWMYPGVSTSVRNYQIRPYVTELQLLFHFFAHLLECIRYMVMIKLVMFDDFCASFHLIVSSEWTQNCNLTAFWNVGKRRLWIRRGCPNSAYGRRQTGSTNWRLVMFSHIRPGIRREVVLQYVCPHSAKTALHQPTWPSRRGRGCWPSRGWFLYLRREEWCSPKQ